MFNSKDNKVKVITSKTPNIVFSPADWSIVSIPENPKEAEVFAKHLYNTPTSRHVLLLLTRYRRNDRIGSIANLKYFNKNWKFLDTVSIVYEKASSCSNNGFLPVSEIGFVMYKGTEYPNVMATNWFNEKKPNATTLWDISRSIIEESSEDIKHTYYQKFSWEIALILYSLSKPLIHRNFIYTLKISDQEMKSLSKFLISLNLSVQLVVKDSKRAEQLVKIHNKISEELCKRSQKRSTSR